MVSDYDNVPESVLRYVRSMEVKELGDDEAWRTPLFERHVQLFKRLKETSDSPWEVRNFLFRAVTLFCRSSSKVFQ